MEDYRLLIDLHKDGNRQGPGSDAATERALELAMVDGSTPLKIADIGCGTGASTLALARLLDAEITAVDLFPEFVEALEARAREEGLADKITTLLCSMEQLPFEEESYDVLWSEGAIYNMGFERGVREWNRYLKTGGRLVVSEITWTTQSRPSEIEEYWDEGYPEIAPASAKIAALERNGYSPLGYFVLSEDCWLENYYRPLLERHQDFLRRNGDSEEARAIVEGERREIELYEKFKAYYGYGVYVATKRG